MIGRRVPSCAEHRYDASPGRFEAIAEALAAGDDPRDTCTVVGRLLATDGTSLEEALGGLRATWLRVRRSDPSYDAVAALIFAWNDATLAYLHQLSCADPVTGLASRVHVRGRLTELYLQSAEVPDRWAMVICELPVAPTPAADGSDGSHGSHRLVHSMRLAKTGHCVRTVFVRGETVGRLGNRRVVALVERNDRLGARVRLLRSLLERAAVAGATPRVWIEGLPASDVTAALLLDDLTR